MALITPWWRRVEPFAEFRRTQGSGGWARSSGFKERCDVRADPELAPSWPFSVESKWQKTVTESAISHFLAGEASPVWAFWDQCVEAAVKDGKRPLLFFRGDRTLFRKRWRVVLEANGRLYLFDGEAFLKLDPRLFLEDRV